jgi:hypothetical protein
MGAAVNIQQTAEGFLADIQSVYGDAVSSVVMYGPAARGGDQSVDGSIGFLVVMHDNTPSELARCAGHLKSWSKQGIATPLFLDNGYIEQSLDTFPLEFMAMQVSHQVLAGEDVLEGLVFDKADVRRQCERELKGKLIHLRAEYLTLRGNAKALMDLVKRSLATFRLVFVGALYLRDIDSPSQTGDILDAVADAYGLDGVFLRKLEAVARGDIKITVAEADSLFDRYVEELMTLSRAIDNLEP